eukprot:364089-Chlamydomonas_euryale.AAC.5
MSRLGNTACHQSHAIYLSLSPSLPPCRHGTSSASAPICPASIYSHTRHTYQRQNCADELCADELCCDCQSGADRDKVVGAQVDEQRVDQQQHQLAVVVQELAHGQVCSLRVHGGRRVKGCVFGQGAACVGLLRACKPVHGTRTFAILCCQPYVCRHAGAWGAWRARRVGGAMHGECKHPVVPLTLQGAFGPL